jgi:hypothetical protein
MKVVFLLLMLCFIKILRTRATWVDDTSTALAQQSLNATLMFFSRHESMCLRIYRSGIDGWPDQASAVMQKRDWKHLHVLRTS